MPKSTTLTNVVLTLNKEEVVWLKGVMQNPLNGKSPENEPATDNDMRRAFWDALIGGNQ
jgi:hypothetical protein